MAELLGYRCSIQLMVPSVCVIVCRFFVLGLCRQKVVSRYPGVTSDSSHVQQSASLGWLQQRAPNQLNVSTPIALAKMNRLHDTHTAVVCGWIVHDE